MESVTIDIRGQICPSTLLTALRALNAHRDRLRRGELELLILTDARDATGTIPEAAGNMGHQARVETRDGHYAIRIGA
ncbi:MAG: sulfurtransferase TusA family protein [Proteobacteria bacterium]|nr:sulfurtransferase TusA family protein [Pseudomonadota bacterium]